MLVGCGDIYLAGETEDSVWRSHRRWHVTIGKDRRRRCLSCGSGMGNDVGSGYIKGVDFRR